MSATSSSMQPLVAADATVTAKFRRKYGIPPKGTPPKGGWADSDYGLPLPPKGHPLAVKFARAVVRRAHQATNFSADDVAKQVRKARAILDAHKKSKGSTKESTPWRDVRWVDAAQRRGSGFASVHPRKSESVRTFLERVPSAMPIARAQLLSETERAALRRSRLRESATATQPWTLAERAGSNTSLREAKVADDGTVQDVLLIRSGPGNPADRHFYTEACLIDAESSGVFEGAKAFLDHPDAIEERARPERSVRHLAGWYSDVKTKPYNDPQLGKTLGLFATFHPQVGKDEVTSLLRTCVEYATRYPRMAYAGLSINALGDGEADVINGEEYNRVDKITEVQSVDIVTRAGAGGTLVPLKESWMGTKTTTDGMRLTLDTEKVHDGITSLLEKAKSAIKKIVESGEGGVKLTPEQDQEFDRALGIVDGGALDQVLDQATGVEDDDEDEEGAMGAGMGEAPAMGAAESLDEATIEKMSPEQLKAALKNANASRIAAEKKAAEATKREREATRESTRATRARMADGVISDLKIPDEYAPRLRRELLSEGYSTARAMREHAVEFDKTFVRPNGGAGVVSPGTGGGANLRKASFSFDGDDN